MKKLLNRLLTKPNWLNLRNLQPISKVFALDRGTPIDRIYIEDYLSKNKQNIKGNVCEVADNTYSKKFGTNVSKYEILHYTDDNQNATIIGDLSDISTIPQNKIDCFILTQTLNFIYDFENAIKGLHYMLMREGVHLLQFQALVRLVDMIMRDGEIIGDLQI
jgi:hypothetical protein